MKKIFGFTFNVCLSMVVFALLLTSCVRKKQDLGNVITKEVKVMPFKDIEVHGNASVHIGTNRKQFGGKRYAKRHLPKERTTFRNNYFEGYTNRCLYNDAHAAQCLFGE